jgi:ubiquinone/menaquinone biosynthesis C-methylase UbiE
MADSTIDESVRNAYDTVAADYSELLRTALTAKPFDRAMLVAFADLIKTGSSGTVADLGCGPGHVTAFLHGQGLDVFGIDLSSQMVAIAKKDYPELRFEVGSIRALALDDGTLGGITAWYSIIHTPPARLPVAFAEFSRVLAEGGYLALAFQVGNEQIHIEQGYGHSVSLDAYRMDPDETADLLVSAGLVVKARLVREPDASETVPQAYVLAQKAAPVAGLRFEI